MEQYTVQIYLVIFAMLIMCLLVESNDLIEKQKKKEFMAIFIVIIFASMSEWCGIYLDGAGARTRVLHIIAKAMDHSLAPVVSFFFLRIISEKSHWRLGIILGIHAALEILSGYFGWIYYVDAQSNYYHGEFYWVYVAFYLICSSYFVIEAWKFGGKYQYSNRIVLGLALLFLISGVAFGMISSNVRTDFICLAMDTMLIYIYYSGIIEKTDVMTGLMNRKSYEGRLQRINEPMYILFFDVDDFKNINDNYGHAYGDECLRIVGNAIRTIYAGKGYCYRIGGDEFCVMADKKIDSIEELNHSFWDYMKKERMKDKRVPYVSVGFSKFDPAKNDYESCVKEADVQMYEWKQKSKASRKRDC